MGHSLNVRKLTCAATMVSFRDNHHNPSSMNDIRGVGMAIVQNGSIAVVTPNQVDALLFLTIYGSFWESLSIIAFRTNQ